MTHTLSSIHQEAPSQQTYATDPTECAMSAPADRPSCSIHDDDDLRQNCEECLRVFAFLEQRTQAARTEHMADLQIQQDTAEQVLPSYENSSEPSHGPAASSTAHHAPQPPQHSLDNCQQSTSTTPPSNSLNTPPGQTRLVTVCRVSGAEIHSFQDNPDPKPPSLPRTPQPKASSPVPRTLRPSQQLYVSPANPPTTATTTHPRCPNTPSPHQDLPTNTTATPIAQLPDRPPPRITINFAVISALPGSSRLSVD